MLPYLRRMESDAELRRPALPRRRRADPGRSACPRDEWGPADDALAESALGLGSRVVRGPQRAHGTGVSPYGINARDGARVTTNDALPRAGARSREPPRSSATRLVDKVLVEARPRGRRAGPHRRRVDRRARRAVVLCAGAIHSPAILLRSGIGPDGPVARLPVGEGMQEHPLALFWFFHAPGRACRALDARQANCLLRYSSGLEGAGENDMMIVSVNQTLALPEDCHLAPCDGGRAAGTWGGAGGGEAAGGPGLLCVWVNQQFARGRLTLASPDPDVEPLIDQDLLNDARRPACACATASSARSTCCAAARSTRPSSTSRST